MYQTKELLCSSGDTQIWTGEKGFAVPFFLYPEIHKYRQKTKKLSFYLTIPRRIIHFILLDWINLAIKLLPGAVVKNNKDNNRCHHVSCYIGKRCLQQAWNFYPRSITIHIWHPDKQQRCSEKHFSKKNNHKEIYKFRFEDLLWIIVRKEQNRVDLPPVPQLRLYLQQSPVC